MVFQQMTDDVPETIRKAATNGSRERGHERPLGEATLALTIEPQTLVAFMRHSTATSSRARE
jgi:hypothetical protein